LTDEQVRQFSASVVRDVKLMEMTTRAKRAMEANRTLHQAACELAAEANLREVAELQITLELARDERDEALLEAYTRKNRIAELEGMLGWLEIMAHKPDGLLLHNEINSTGRLGLGLLGGLRTLPQAITQAMLQETQE
jgi:hypothetical protein